MVLLGSLASTFDDRRWSFAAGAAVGQRRVVDHAGVRVRGCCGRCSPDRSRGGCWTRSSPG
nr:hypothetical protein [Modestobacter sp. DSM 44400]